MIELLRAVQQMQKLKQLDLHDAMLQDSLEPKLYAALTASSQLVLLDISGKIIDSDAYQYMFPADASLAALTSLATSSGLLCYPTACERLVACCPALQQLAVFDDYGQEPVVPEVSLPVALLQHRGSSGKP